MPETSRTGGNVQALAAQSGEQWQRLVELERGRLQVLSLLAKGASLTEVLKQLCATAERYNPAMICSILQKDEQDRLHHLASVSLPQTYIDAIDGVRAGPNIGSCGTAAYLGQRVIVDNIDTHPYWALFKGVAHDAGLHACWSEPVVGDQGQVLGTFAIYYGEPAVPTEDDLHFIEVSASLTAVAMGHWQTRQALLAANEQLTQNLDERSRALEMSNLRLKQMLAEQQLLQRQLVESARLTTTSTLMAGFVHELNTPLGIAITSNSDAVERAQLLAQALLGGKLTRTDVEARCQRLNDILALVNSNLSRLQQLIDRVRQIDIVHTHTVDKALCLEDFFHQFEASVSQGIQPHRLNVVVESGLSVYVAPGDLFQLMMQLLDNSLQHGFRDKAEGQVRIHVHGDDCNIVIDYQDDGCGIPTQHESMVFEPFYSGHRGEGFVGIGLTLASQIVGQLFGGQLTHRATPVGCWFEIAMPTRNTAS